MHSNDLLDCYKFLSLASSLCLVDVCDILIVILHCPSMHAGTWFEQLVKKVVRRVKPNVVMVEIDPYRIKMLPPGEATKVGVVVCTGYECLRGVLVVLAGHIPVQGDVPTAVHARLLTTFRGDEF